MENSSGPGRGLRRGDAHRRVLLVDADDSLRFSCVMHLLEQGFEVFQGDRVEETMTLAQRHRPQVVVLDLGRQVDVGIGLVRRLAANPLAGQPLTLVTCDPTTQRALVEALAAAGVRQVLLKPYTPQDLHQRIERAWQDRVAHSPVVPPAAPPPEDRPIPPWEAPPA